jgi:hypothetical protein
MTRTKLGLTLETLIEFTDEHRKAQSQSEKVAALRPVINN